MAGNDIAKLFGEAIAERRHARGMTQEEFANKLGLSIDSVSRMENGRMAPKMSRFQDIAEVLGCSVTDLFRKTDGRASDRAVTITEILEPLSDDAQEALVDIVARAAPMMKKA